LERIIVDREMCGLLDELWVQYRDSADQVGPMLLEQCLEMRWQWEELPKIPRSVRETVAKRVRSKALELATIMEGQAEALRAYHAPSLSLAGLFPEHLGGEHEAPEIMGVEVAEVLRRLAARLRYPTTYPGLMELPDQPLHDNAYRTATVQQLNTFFWTFMGKPNYRWVAMATNLIVNDPASEIEANHVAKLDPRATESVKERKRR
jgi:hypothetical protein